MILRKLVTHGLFAVIVSTCVIVAAPTAGAQLRGDSAAVAAVEHMLEAVGGRTLWAAHRTLELQYRAWILTPTAQRVTEHAWRDLAEPNQRIELRSDSVMRVSAFTPSGEWRLRNGVRQPISDLQFRRTLSFWPRDYYTLFRRFAVVDPDLFVSSASGGRVVVHSERLGELGWFEIASDGMPVRWGTVDDGEPLEYVYGPLKGFGAIRFPAWGASLDGSWRFEYTSVALRSGPIPPAMLLPPG